MGSCWAGEEIEAGVANAESAHEEAPRHSMTSPNLTQVDLLPVL